MVSTPLRAPRQIPQRPILSLTRSMPCPTRLSGLLPPLFKALFCRLRPTPSQMGLAFLAPLGFNRGRVPPSGGSLEYWKRWDIPHIHDYEPKGSPFGGIPRILESGKLRVYSVTRQQGSPFGGIPRILESPRSRGARSAPGRFPLRGDP